MKSKWISRKLFVAILSLAAIVFTIHTNTPELEGDIIGQGSTMIDLLMTLGQGIIAALVGCVYVWRQSKVDEAEVKNGSA